MTQEVEVVEVEVEEGEPLMRVEMTGMTARSWASISVRPAAVSVRREHT